MFRNLRLSSLGWHHTRGRTGRDLLYRVPTKQYPTRGTGTRHIRPGHPPSSFFTNVFFSSLNFLWRTSLRNIISWTTSGPNPSSSQVLKSRYWKMVGDTFFCWTFGPGTRQNLLPAGYPLFGPIPRWKGYQVCAKPDHIGSHNLENIKNLHSLDFSSSSSHFLLIFKFQMKKISSQILNLVVTKKSRYLHVLFALAERILNDLSIYYLRSLCLDKATKYGWNLL